MFLPALILAVFFFTSPALAQNAPEPCTYHHRGGGELNGVPIFLEFWKQGCTAVHFIQHEQGTNGKILLPTSPCDPHGFGTWFNWLAPGTSYASHIHGQKKNGWAPWHVLRDERGISGLSMWCGDQTKSYPAPTALVAPSDPCAYHHRDNNKIDGGAIFLDLWKKGCTNISFIQYQPGDVGGNGMIFFSDSPCKPYNLELFYKGLPPPGALSRPLLSPLNSKEWKRDLPSGVAYEHLWMVRDKHSISGITLFCTTRANQSVAHAYPGTATVTAQQPTPPTFPSAQTASIVTPTTSLQPRGTSGTLSTWIMAFCLLSGIAAFVFLLYHSPTKAPELPQDAPEPEDLPPGSSLLGLSAEDENELIIPAHLRNRHLYLIGKTRTGKTTLIKNLALQDMEDGFGVCFVDPHGDAALDLIGSIPNNRLKDVIYFDPALPYAPAFNLFRLPYPAYKITEDFISCLKLFFDSWGQRLEHLLRHALLTLLHDTEPHSLRDLRLLLINKTFRADVIARIEDPDLQEFWENEFPNMSKDATSPIVNRLSAFLSPGSPMQKIFSQPENDLDFWRIMNEQKILIVNLAKGVLGDEGARLLGGMIVTAINQSAMARAELPPEQRKEFVMYLDEFQNFAVDSMASILSESAKYRLYLSLAHQTLGQVSSTLRSCIFGNIASMVSFGISAEDAATMRKEMHRSRISVRIPETPDYISLADFVAYQKQQLRTQLASRRMGLSKKEFRHVASTDRLKGSDGFIANMKGAAREVDTLNALQQQAARTVSTLERPDLNVAVMKELFPDYQFREESFPEVDDFINLQPHHAFARIERAENVTVFRTLPAPDPDPDIKAFILEDMQSLYEARQQQRAKADAPDSTASNSSGEAAHAARQKSKPASANIRQPKKATDDDFSY